MFFFTYGVEAMRDRSPVVFVIALGLAGLSQNFWKIGFLNPDKRSKAELASFSLGLLAAVAYPILCIFSYLSVSDAGG